MQLLGPSLEDLFNYSHRQFTLKTVLHLADQMIQRVETVHNKGFIHRDIKPDNFLMGSGNETSKVFIIDFGLSKKFRDSRTRGHIPFRTDKSLTGTWVKKITIFNLISERSPSSYLSSIYFGSYIM